MECLDHNLRLELEQYVEEITLSGKHTLDEKIMKKLKKICKTSDVYVEHAYRLLMTQLNKDHSEIRLSAFLIIDELFRRSHIFRELLMNDFHVFLELTIESDYCLPLPPPKNAAMMLKTSTQKAIQQWYEKYGEAYKKLSLGFNFLRNCKRVDFNDIRARSLAERSREEAKAKKKSMALKKKLVKTLKEMEDSFLDMQTCLTEVENGFNLIVPSLGDFFLKDIETEIVTLPQSASNSGNKSELAGVTSCDERQTNNPQTISVTKVSSPNQSPPQALPVSDVATMSDSEGECENEGDAEVDDSQLIHQHGLGSRNYNISIEIPKDSVGVSIEENEDTADILRMLKDQYQLINRKYLPSLQKWLNIFGKAGASEVDMKKAIDMKCDLETLKQKFIDLKVIPANTLSLNDSDVSSDDDFEDVPEKEGYEPHIPVHLRAEYGLDESTTNSTCSNSSVKTSKKTAATVTSKSMKTETVTSNSADPEKHTSSYWNMTCHSFLNEEKDPTTITANLGKRKDVCVDTPQPSSSREGCEVKSVTDLASSRKKQLLKTAPVLPFGVDLAYWSNPEDIKAPMVEKYESLHRFWVPPEVQSERSSYSDIANLTCRNFEFAGKFEPVKWKCRAPLPNGKLCERMDRNKCPFHGVVIPRNIMGMPDRKEDREQLVGKTPIEHNPVSDWQDPELLRDIEAATGINLEIKSKDKKKGKKEGKKKGNGKYSKLTDVEQTKNNSRNRLEKKVFNRTSVKRVCAAMDAASYKRTRDKYANQFNYI